MKIRTKLTIFANLIVWATGIGILVATSLIYRTSLNDSFAQAHEMESVKWQAVCYTSLAEKNLHFLANYAQVLAMQPGVEAVYYAGRDGKVVAYRLNALGGLEPSSRLSPPGPDSLQLSLPIVLEEREVGSAVLVFSRSFQTRMVDRMLLIAFIKVLFVTLFMAAATILASGLFADRIGRQLIVLRAAALEIERGNFTVRIPPSSDELSFFTGYFNRVAERLATLDQYKNDFISSVSHDLKSPLAVIQMIIQNALITDPEDAPLPAEYASVLNRISDLASRNRIYIGNILDSAKLKAGEVEYHLQPVPVEPVLQQAKALYTLVAEQKRVSLEVAAPPDLPPIRADNDCFEHAVTNLLSNALKFTPVGGRITLSARLDADCVEVSVADTGQGISPEDLPNLFQRFRQFDVAKQHAAKIKGTGLGLFIVKSGVEGMGGTVSVESQVGKGTRFTLRMPRADSAATGPAGPPAAANL